MTNEFGETIPTEEYYKRQKDYMRGRVDTMYCHWCGKLSMGYYCSPRCYVEHDRRFEDWLVGYGFDESMTTEEMIDNLNWNLNSDGSVISLSSKDNTHGSFPGPTIPAE